ncbi:hypothetical protein CcaverHIS631_0503300 [Cutaneotrichosporon cavernicola]|nr:hypothetical protein CcaverHIS631_0503300 [Cutaneotrichosporon cavernicola]BEJ08242.1 hypothetical protein CcaverHIS641_0503270 [Cutaneotrichosporon cavernicola]
MPLRLEDAQCSICIENLFDHHDDLDEVLPIATPDCGHVFHERCLFAWFTSQANAYLAQMVDQGAAVTIADAPAECPECRAECFADPETGEPAVHRLYINFSRDERSMSQAQSSQHVPSSPSMRWRSADKMVLGLARRARGVAAELDAAGPDSHEDDVRGALRRAEALRADAVSSKAAEGFKKYMAGLTAAVNKLHNRLEEHPLIGTLEGRVRTLEDQLAAAQREHARSTLELERRMQAELERVILKERGKAERDVARATKERDTMQREVEKSKIALHRGRTAAGEREADLQAKLAEAQRLGAIETQTRTELQKDLADRTKTLKMWQAKAEKRGQMKGKLEELRAENEALRAVASTQHKGSQRAQFVPSSPREFRSEPEPIDRTLEIEVEAPTLDSLLDHMNAECDKRSTTARTFSFGSPSPPRNLTTTARSLLFDDQPRSSTARTLSFDMDQPKPRRSGTGRPEAVRSNPATSSKYFGRPYEGGPERSKPVRAAVREPSQEGLGREKTRSGMQLQEQFAKMSDNAQKGKQRLSEMRNGVHLAALSDPAPVPRPHVLVDCSSPIRPKRPLEVIEIGSSPEISERRHDTKPTRPDARRVQKEPSILEYLGVDSRGRQRGVMTGAKVRRRA